MRIFCDFDGTISIKDTTDEILNRFAAPEWEDIEQQWKNGEIGSAECMRRQIALINASKSQLDAALAEMEIDQHFPAFVRFCEGLGAPVTVISDGVDYFINSILQRNGISLLPVIANSLTINSDDTYSLSCPHANPACAKASGVCKCAKIGGGSGFTVFVGDGRSDFCAAGSANVLFAKSSLAKYCREKNIPYLPYDNFSDVQHALEAIALENPAAINPEYAKNFPPLKSLYAYGRISGRA